MKYQLGKRLSELRNAKGMTQEEVANFIGVTSQSVSKWENNLSCPDIMLLPELAKLFKVTIDSLFSLESDMNDLAQLNMHIIVKSEDDSCDIKIPISQLKVAYEQGGTLDIEGLPIDDLDYPSILKAAEAGFRGKIIDVNISDSESVTIIIE